MGKASIVVMNDYSKVLNSVMLFLTEGQMNTQRSDEPFTVEDMHDLAVENGYQTEDIDFKIVTL